MNRNDPFGYSLALVDGDLVFDNGTLQTVSGKRSLLQALELRVLTPFGSDIFNTGYGLNVAQAFTQPGSIRMVKELIKLSLVQTLGTDPRVHDIREVLFEDDPSYLARHPELKARDIDTDRRTRYWRVDVVIETVDAQAQTLSLSIGV